ncbi:MULTISPECIES: hypothetical protein [unclassified Microbacterium]|uniref:hypothetical protein n=1 Tax=unclassified Microbacterium TaxID=2609290 RepID=UPI000CFBCEF8|nr:MULTISPECIES: hypothetical protein [unclassified Microbacterium]PQZ53158.1 hypothetical protein CQ032_15750 [Microbacterium sp. MYb43]PQZ74700.1 hypothetical protein CQ031_15095 [Microbacterium sp. MYb40]PRB18788.1 hypothetical protein CQ040_16400 [Microbacterium sp. MYb54]PRB23648.1 hypothetical protein CQ037_17200 [Microbacterium sp. MYb50]PRB63343.1 hypothetical protein CQ021_16705 [Microbacterium sp. MYb24]
MPFFEINAEAQQFTGRESIDAVAELVKRYRPGASTFGDPKAGTLRFINSGPEITIEMGSWVVAFGGDVVVVSQAEFDAAVTRPVDESDDREQR